MFMDGQQQGNPIGNFGAQPPRPSGVRRGLQSLGMMSRIGIAGGAALVALAALDPFVEPNHSPLRAIAYGLGTFGGGVISAEQNAAREAIVRNTEAQADAAARAEAKKMQQVIAAEHAQNMRDAALFPQLMGSWFSQFTCMIGVSTGDSQKQRACGMVPMQNEAITAQQGGAIDSIGNARQWGGAPAQQNAPMIAAAPAAPSADGPPLNRGEFDAVARLEGYLSAQATAAARQNLPPGNNGMHLYLARLRQAAGEAGVGAEYNDRPHVVQMR